MSLPYLQQPVAILEVEGLTLSLACAVQIVYVSLFVKNAQNYSSTLF